MKSLGGWAGIKRRSLSLLRPWQLLEKLPDHNLNRETLTKERSSFLARDFFCLQDQISSWGNSSWGGGGSRRGFKEGFSIHTPSHLPPASEWHSSGLVLLTRGLQWLSVGPNSAFQGQRLDEMSGTDAKSVYCVYYAAALGVTYLNPCAARRGNAPHARLLVLSNPLNSLLRIQHAAVAAAPWTKRDMHQSHVETDLHLGSGRVNRGDACRSRSIPLVAFLALAAEARPHTARRHHFKFRALQQDYSRFSLGR